MMRLFLDDFVLVYLDDIMIFSTSWEEHMGNVEKVLEMLKQHRFRLNRKKCEFGRSSLVYLNFVMGDGELRIDPNKVRAIWE